MTNLDDEMAEAVHRQFDHAAASHAMDRRGWTRQQWVDDARRQIGDLHGSVLDLLNGHVMALFEEIDDLKARLVNEVAAEHLRAAGFDAFVTVEDEDTPEVPG